MVDLDAELRSANRALSIVHLRRLEGLGVSRDTIAEFGRHRPGFGFVHAADAGNGLYEPGGGIPHLVVPVYENDALVDLCAVRSDAPERWLLRTGLGWALGLERGLECHTWGDAVSLIATPLEWLQRDCDGLCVLDWDAPEVRYLIEVPHLVCSSAEVASLFRSALAKPKPFPTISVEGMSLAA